MTPTGTPQSAILNTAYTPLSVRITDASNNPISGLGVTFTANAVAGASGTFPGQFRHRLRQHRCQRHRRRPHLHG